MRYYKIVFFLPIIIFFTACEKDQENNILPSNTESMIIDHLTAKLSAIPSEWITAAKQNLHIAYGHTSHGSQLTSGMTVQ